MAAGHFQLTSNHSCFSGRGLGLRPQERSDLLLDEGVLQGLVDADALGRVQHQGAVQQVLELHHLLPLVLWQPLAADHVHQEVFGGVDGAHHRHLLLNSGMEKSETKEGDAAHSVRGKRLSTFMQQAAEAPAAATGGSALPFLSLCRLQCTGSSNSDRSAGL